MESQIVEYIPLVDLVLWSENPRDPIEKGNNDQTIVDYAIGEHKKKWMLEKLAMNMGEVFDQSELPIVVYHRDIPIVYDGNRRVILAKIKHGLVNIPEEERFLIPDFPELIPCNVCEKKVALKHVLRKHGDSGSWSPLERDIFLHKHMNDKKSDFLIIEEATGLIGNMPFLNRGFVKNEIFRPENIRKLGFSTDSGELKSKYDAPTANKILMELAEKIEAKEITTRKNRGNVLGVLDGAVRKIIDSNASGKADKKCRPISNTQELEIKKTKRRSPRTQNKNKIFGGPLYISSGELNNIYRDIFDLYEYYVGNQHVLSSTFVSVIRMSLRLMCEAAAKEKNHTEISSYIHKYFDEAKLKMNKDIKTTLSNNNVNKLSIHKIK